MSIQNDLNLTATGVITHNGAGVFTASTVTEGAILLGGASNAISDTGVLAKGDLVVGDGTTAPTLLTVGTNDYVLTADSAQASGVKWAAAAAGSGALTLLATATASASASLDFTSSIDSTYNAFLFIFDQIAAATDGTTFAMRTSLDGGSTFDSGATDYTNADVNTSISAGSTYILLCGNCGNATNETGCGKAILFNPSSTSGWKFIERFHQHRNSSGNLINNTGASTRRSTSAVNAVQFFMITGNITSGTIKMYGMTTPS